MEVLADKVWRKNNTANRDPPKPMIFHHFLDFSPLFQFPPLTFPSHPVTLKQ